MPAAVTNLPRDYAVEVPRVVDEQGVRPEYVGDLPIQCAALTRDFASVRELTVKAAVTGGPRLVRLAAQVDPNAAATLTVDAIWALCDELTIAHGELIADEPRVPVRR
jgi:alpha-galactosidase